MTHSATYTALLEGCSLFGCPVCRVEHDNVVHYLDGLFYEQVNDYGVRERLRASLGFCPEHAYLVMDDMQGNALGLAMIYNDVLKGALDQLGQHKQKEKCLACVQRDEVAQRILSELANHIQDDDCIAALKKSNGLCLPHLQQALEQMRTAEKRNALISAQRGIIERLRRELAEYIRKNDYRFAKETFGAERDSWRRAVAIVAGMKRQKGGKR